MWFKKIKKKSINHSSRTGIRVGISSWEKGRKWKRLFFIWNTFLQSQACLRAGVYSWAQKRGPWLEEEYFEQNELCSELGSRRGRGRWGTLGPTRGVIAKGCQAKTLLHPPSLQHSYRRALFQCQDKEQEAHLKGKSSDFYISTSLSA